MFQSKISVKKQTHQHGTLVGGESTPAFKRDSDVKRFFFFFENAIMRPKNHKEKASESVHCPNGATFDFFYAKFSADDETNYEASEFSCVKKALID